MTTFDGVSNDDLIVLIAATANRMEALDKSRFPSYEKEVEKARNLHIRLCAVWNARFDAKKPDKQGIVS